MRRRPGPERVGITVHRQFMASREGAFGKDGVSSSPLREDAVEEGEGHLCRVSGSGERRSDRLYPRP